MTWINRRPAPIAAGCQDALTRINCFLRRKPSARTTALNGKPRHLVSLAPVSNREAMLKFADFQTTELATDATKVWLQFAATF